VAACVSGRGVCTEYGARHPRIFTDYFYKSVTLSRLSVSSLRMAQADRNM